MKRRTKILLIAAAALILIGGTVAFAAWTMGAHTSLYWDRGFRIENRQLVDIDETLDRFTEIDLRLGVARVTVEHGRDYHISGTIHDSVRFSVEDGTLVVTDTRRTRGFQFGWNTSFNDDRLTITVPSHVELDALRLDVGVGSLTLRDIHAVSANITTGTASTTTENISFARASFDSGVGAVSIGGALTERSEITTGTGAVTISGTLTGQSEINTGVGSVTIRLSGDRDDYAYSISTGVGSVTVDGSRHPGGVTRSTANPVAYLTVSTGTGSVSLDFRG